MIENRTLYGRCHVIKDWSDWEYSLHSDDSQIVRQGRAMTYPFTFRVNRNDQTARFSSTSQLPYYDTTLSSCTCGDFECRKLPCKHIYRLASELGIIEIIKRQPNHSFDKKKLEETKNSSNIDNEPDQIKRQKSSMSSKCTPSEIDFENKTAVFKGSGKSPYSTTLTTCTCRDYFVRKLPCKHIYRLRYELNSRGLAIEFAFSPEIETAKIDTQKNIQMNKTEALDIIYKLPVNVQIAYKDFCYTCGNNNKHGAGLMDNYKADLLIENHLAKVCDNIQLILAFAKMSDLRKLLPAGTKAPAKKVDLINMLSDLVDIEQAQSLVFGKVLQLSPNIEHLAATIHRELCKSHSSQTELHIQIGNADTSVKSD